MVEQQKSRMTSTTVHSAPQGDAMTIDLVELMYRLLASWKLILCLALAFAIGAGIFTIYCVTPMYEATSTIYVLSRKDSAINMSDLQIGSALTSDYIKVFQMWEVHEKVISNLNLPYSYSQIQKKLSVVNDSDTRMLDITFTSASPQEAADVANEYAKVASEFIADTMSTEKPNIMSVALVPTNPSSPNKTKNIMLGFILGCMFGAGIVTLKMLVNDTYKTAEDIRKYTGLPTLAIVPIENETDVLKRKKESKRMGERKV